jgi:integrase
MIRRRKTVPGYRHHKASGQAIVTLNGRDIYLGEYRSRDSKQNYDRYVAEWLAAGRRPSPSASAAALTIVEVLAAFKRHAEQYYCKNGRPTRTADHFRPLYKLIHSLYGRDSAASFGPLALKVLQNKLVERGLSRSYVNDSTKRIKQIFKWAVSEELIPASVHQALVAVPGLRKGKTSAHETPPVMAVPDHVIQATLPSLSSVVRDMVQIQRLTGARPNEVVAMRPIDIERSEEIWRYIPQEHKSEHHGKQRVILIGPRARQILEPYLNRKPEDYCFSPETAVTEMRGKRRAARKTPPSCGNGPGDNRKCRPRRTPGSRYTSNTYRRAIHRACEVAFGMPEKLRHFPAGLSDSEIAALREQAAAWRAEHCWSPNQLRHTAGTAIRKRFGAEAAQTVLGHSHLTVTEIYAERDLEKAAEVIRQLG